DLRGDPTAGRCPRARPDARSPDPFARPAVHKAQARPRLRRRQRPAADHPGPALTAGQEGSVAKIFGPPDFRAGRLCRLGIVMLATVSDGGWSFRMILTSCPARLKGHRFPRSVIGYAVWLYHRFAALLHKSRQGFRS